MPILFWFVIGLAQSTNENVMTRPADASVNPGFRTTQTVVRFVLEDGSQPPKEWTVLSTYCPSMEVFGTGTVTFRGFNCQLIVQAPGVRSFRGYVTEGRTVILKRLGEHEGSTISVTILRAPQSARKAYAKGAEHMLHKRYQEARKFFLEAIREYPKYALAHSELGRVYENLGEIDQARKSYQDAIQADRRYIKPLVQLAALEAKTQRWQECAKASEAAIKLYPIEFPGAYFYGGMAALARQNWATATAHLKQAQKLDTELEFPRTAVLLATSLQKQANPKEAAAVLEAFLALGPKPDEAARAEELLAKIRAGLSGYTAK